MSRREALWVGMAAAALALAVRPAAAEELREQRTVRESWELPAAGGAVVVDNLRGGISVTAHEGRTVELVARETVIARDAAWLERARGEVRLGSERVGDTVRLVVDHPGRCRDGRKGSGQDRGYQVTWEFELRVPREVDLELSTVLAGDVIVRGVRGDFAVANVEGSVLLEDVAGTGAARSVNGDVRVGFAANPHEDWRFATVNGELEVALRRGPAVDVQFRTLNGEAYTDFPYTLVTRTGDGSDDRRRDGRRVFRSSRTLAARIGAGGPLLRFETTNGDILIRDRDSQEAMS